MNRLVMFDIDGTILNTEDEDHIFETAMKQWLHTDSVNNDWGAYEHMTDAFMAAQMFLNARGEEPSRENLEEAVEIYFNGWKEKLMADASACRPMSGVFSFFEKLKNTPGVTLAIATGGWEKTATLKLSHSKMPWTDMALATSNDAVTREEIMQIAHDRAARKAGVPGFQKIVYFGDGEWDAVASRNLGYDFIGIDSSNRKDVLFRRGAIQVFKNYQSDDHIFELICRN